MGSAGEEPFKPIDGSVGSLVWVRRRNGSWWPGRILSLDELPEGCLPTPRSGTPVKLLGREDASVDWYNLEKSKRVKPFRCGEYDDCIEKAKSSASHLSKKAVKYARREDAILHALELENARLGIPDMSTGHDTRDDEQHLNKKSPPSEQSEKENMNGGLSSSEDDSDSAPEPSLRSVVSFEEPKCVKRRRTPNDSEDDGTEGVKKRMRGLEDLGMGIASSLRRKRSQNSHAHEFLKKKNRRRTLSKVLECTPMMSVPVASGFESNESNKNNNYSDSTTGGVSLNLSRNGDDDGVGTKAKENEISSVVGIGEDGSCERLFEVPLVAEEKQQSAAGVSKTVSGPSHKTQVGAGAHSSQSSHVETISLGNEEHNETGSTGSGPADVHNSITIEKNTSEWQLKGKRNSRPRKIDIDEESETHAAGSNRVHGSLISDVVKKETQVEEFRGWSWNVPPQRENIAGGSKSDAVAPQRLLPYRQSRFTVNPKYESSDFSLSHHMSNGEPALYDVNVEVRTSYRPQHVPYISLMSKLNGKPVVGHPLSIKVLDDGFCDELLSLGPECYSSSSELEYNCLNGLSERKPRGRPPSKRRSTSKSRRNRPKNGLLSKKIRKLSSLTGSHRKSQHDKNLVLENLKGPSIACVPIKVVFSRINAALSSSIRPPPRLTTTSGIEDGNRLSGSTIWLCENLQTFFLSDGIVDLQLDLDIA
ncbi:uncharacterized protein at1g51745 [Phtheirospermum japonicum]|uniref:Uncharacterized protein at1g51745 n=1 Tax=Phtheirospermum japonicum TaxID=374723 RepID=A0A830BGS7_9LAMI|nr:uncharacterized protein at1g51745 [Phtheirospermum japonicum]